MEKRSSMIMIILFLIFVILIHLLAVTSLKVRTIQSEMDYYAYTQHWPGTKEADGSIEQTDNKGAKSKTKNKQPGTNEADGSTEQTDKPTTSFSSSSKGAKSKTKNKQQSTSTTAGEQKNPDAPGTNEANGSTEQTDKPTTSSSSSSKGTKSKTKNKQQSTSTVAEEQKNPKAGWRITGLVSGLWGQKKPTLKPDHENFGIHGLWPQYFNGNPYPQYCLKQDGGLPERYDFSEIEHLYDRLTKHWHSLASPYEDGHAVKSQNKFGLDKKDKEGIWEHEWEKHGTCSSFERQREYFKTTLELREPSNLEDPLTWKNISNLLEALYEEDIIPNGSSYPIDKIKTAIEKKIKVEPRIECNAKNELYQVHICLMKKDLGLIDCSISGDTVLVCKKGKNIIFPSFPEKAIDHQEL